MNKQQAEQIKKDVQERIGDTIGTVWGPCRVQGLGEDTEGIGVVLLSESEEGFFVYLEDWKEFDLE